MPVRVSFAVPVVRLVVRVVGELDCVVVVCGSCDFLLDLVLRFVVFVAVVGVVDGLRVVGLATLESIMGDGSGGLWEDAEDRGFFCTGEKNWVISVEDMSVVRLICRPSCGGGGK